ncbi:UNVERIFIED_CONTAM: hypothetical protein FKN15_024540 [Acipenser sinensis]
MCLCPRPSTRSKPLSFLSAIPLKSFDQVQGQRQTAAPLCSCKNHSKDTWNLNTGLINTDLHPVYFLVPSCICRVAMSTVGLDWNNRFLEASAKDNENVVEVFSELLQQANLPSRLSPALRRRRETFPKDKTNSCSVS